MNTNDVKVQNGIILRQWIGYTPRVVDKIENLHIFKQILELMECAHSQGMLLGNIHPSCFVLSSLNRVEFLESPASQVNLKCSKDTICPSTNPIDHLSKPQQMRKRCRQYLLTGVVQDHGHSDTCDLMNKSVKLSDTGSGSSCRTSSVDQNIAQSGECEANPRSSRIVPFVSKAIGHPLAKYATFLMSGKSLQDIGFT